MTDPSDQIPALPPLFPLVRLHRWLEVIFPEGTPHRGYVTRTMAARTIFTLLYVGAVEGRGRWLRPAQVTLMTNRQATRRDPAAREAWAKDSLVPGRIRQGSQSWFATNTRESIRDETLRSGLIAFGAVIERANVPTTSSRPRYALARDFLALLQRLDAGSEPRAAVAAWQKDHLGEAARMRIDLARRAMTPRGAAKRLPVRFPNGETRLMRPGPSTEIARAVLERFAPRMLREPAVLLVSESGEKFGYRDETELKRMGLEFPPDRVLPDLVLYDAHPERSALVIVEVVASDGGVTLERREALLSIVQAAGYPPESVFLVTAFADRSRPEFRRLIGEIAWGTYVWFASEPENLMVMRSGAEFDLPVSST